MVCCDTGKPTLLYEVYDIDSLSNLTLITNTVSSLQASIYQCVIKKKKIFSLYQTYVEAWTQ